METSAMQRGKRMYIEQWYMEIEHMGQDSSEFLRMAGIGLSCSEELTANLLSIGVPKPLPRRCDWGPGICILERPSGNCSYQSRKI